MQNHRILCAGISILLCCLLLAGTALPASAEMMPPYLQSEAAILMDAETGQILFEKNSRERMYPASITKIMTGMLALTYLTPDQTITISQQAYDAVPRTSSHIGLQPGEELTVEQAMYALAMQSANDAANGLAEAVSGSQEEFARLMTETAHALGAVDTQFTNANGLPDDGHYTTARDMALITAEALKTPGFCQYFSTINYHMLPTNLYPDIRSFVNPNQILAGQYSYGGVLMSKTGWTSSAWGTLVTAVKQRDTTLIAVTLKSQYLEDKYQDTCALFDYGFTHFSKVALTGEELAAGVAAEGFVPAEGQEFSCLLPEGTKPSDLRFSLAEGTDLSSVHGQTEVSVTAAAGDTALPEMRLLLRRSEEGAPLTAAAAAPVSGESEPVEPEAAGIPWLPVVIAAVIVSLTICGFLILRKRALAVPAQ